METIKLLLEMREAEPVMDGDGSALPPIILKELKRLIRKGARDLQQKWKDSLHLVRKAYDVTGYKIPSVLQKDAWTQYEHLIAFAVRELANARGLKTNTSWRLKKPQQKNDNVLPDSVLPLPLGTEFKS